MIKKTFFLFCIFILLIGIIPSAELIKEISTATLENVGSLISDELANEDISVASATITKEGDNNRISFFGENPSAKIKNDLFENIDTNELAYLELNDLGEIVTADLTASEDTIFSFDGTPYEVNKGGRIYYKDGKVISYGKSIGIKEESSDKFTTLDCLGESLEFEKDDSGNSIVAGNLKIGNDEAMGKVTLSNGKISEVWTDSDVTINGINNKISGKNVKISYDNNFDLSNCNGNCINYGDEKISLMGSGFTTNLGEENNLFGNMENEKSVGGIIKTRDLEIELNEGILEISKDMADSDLSFNVQGEGNYIINNGRAIIESQKMSKIINGEAIYSGDYLFVKATEDKEGVLYSYDLNFNEGEYKLEDNIFTNEKGYVRFNGNTPGENVIYNINNLDKNKVAEIIKDIEKEKGARARDYTYLVDEENQEELMKWFYEATDSANQNIYGIKISPEELWTRVMLEGGAYYEEGYIVHDYDNIGHDVPVWGSTLGMDHIGDPSSLKKLIDPKFVPEGFQLNPSPMTNELYQDTTSAYFDNIKDALTGFAGELARRKYVFETDFKKAYGEEEFKKITDDEKYFWLTYYFNAGEGAGKGELTGTKYNTYDKYGDPIVAQGEGREKVYLPWIGPKPGTWESGIGEGRSARFNALLSESTYSFIKKLGIFNWI